MKYMIYIISVCILVISLVITELCTRKIRTNRVPALFPPIICLCITELMLITCYLITYDLFHLENFGAALLFFQTFSMPMALVMVLTMNQSTARFLKILMIILVLGSFNLLYFWVNTLYSPWWAYSMIIDIMAVATSLLFPINTAKVIFLECSLGLCFLIRAMSDNYYDYLRDDVDKYILMSFTTILIYRYFIHIKKPKLVKNDTN